jgi:hypothetical protein
VIAGQFGAPIPWLADRARHRGRAAAIMPSRLIRMVFTHQALSASRAVRLARPAGAEHGTQPLGGCRRDLFGRSRDLASHERSVDVETQLPTEQVRPHRAARGRRLASSTRTGRAAPRVCRSNRIAEGSEAFDNPGALGGQCRRRRPVFKAPNRRLTNRSGISRNGRLAIV